jgi:hypothetical protein
MPGGLAIECVRVLARQTRSYEGSGPRLSARSLLGIGAARQNREGAVDLLGQHHPCEFVGISHLAEREFRVLAIEQDRGESVGVAANEDQLACAAIALIADPFRESVRREPPPVGVEQHDGCGAIRIELFRGGLAVADFGDFDRRLVANASDVVFENGSHFGAASLSQH